MTDATRDAVEFPDDVIRAVCEVETRYIQGFTYSETHVIRDVMRPAAEDTIWRGPACTPKNAAAFYAQCTIEKMRRQLTALNPHITALIAAAREEEREVIADACRECREDEPPGDAGHSERHINAGIQRCIDAIDDRTAAIRARSAAGKEQG